MDIETFLSLYSDEFINIRRKLHQLAEPSGEEYKTGNYIKSLLKGWNIPYEYPVADTGLTATIYGNKPGNGKTIAFRADMDALPISECAACPYHSLTPGTMHACGHDIHMAIALGIARFFKLNEDYFCGCIRLFFQPAEETIGGAARMIKEGCMIHPPVDYVIGLHVAPYLETGTVEVKYDNLYAASDEVSIVLHGKSSHGAYPESGIDTIVMAAYLISSLQTLVSRNISPSDQCVLSLGTISGGTAHNIIADKVTLTGALRTTSPRTRQLAKEKITTQVSFLTKALGGTGNVTFQPGYDALINTNTLVDIMADTASSILGKEHVLWKNSPGMGVDDFSFFLNEAPGFFYHLGCGNKKEGKTAPLHSPEFFPDENSIALGIHLQIEIANALLKTDI